MITLLSLFALCGNGRGVFAQSIPTASDGLYATPIGTSLLLFNSGKEVTQCTIPEAPIQWGMDVAWNDKSNVWRGTNYIGKQILTVGRVSFQPSDLVDSSGNLSATQQATLASRLNNLSVSGVKDIILNCDHEVLCNKDSYPLCDTYYANYNGKPTEWYRVIKATVQYCWNHGYNVIAISPFNEPDYSSWKEGSKDDFKAIAKLLSEDTDLAGIRISAGNTLNCDQAATWYAYMKPYVTEGNTHQLAGSFDNYASFWQTVRKDGNHATADELHNTMEAVVGIHYGMQTGIWWGYDGECRGEFCKASFDGKEIGYAENRTAWSAGAIYKRPNGQIAAFLGTSERQATNSSYELVATDREVFYDGEGPFRSLVMEMPGGTAYQTGQTNAERMIQIQYGTDVPLEPLTDGQQYVIMNKNSKNALSYKGGNSGDAIELSQRNYSGISSPTYMRWEIKKVAPRVGGDFGYFALQSVRDTAQVVDIKDWSLESGGSVIAYAGGMGTNEQWCAEYAGNGYWYLRSRHSGLYLEVKGASTYRDALVQQAAFTGADCQQWRFQQINSALEVKAPAAPTGLIAEAHSGSIVLTWNKNTETDVVGYEVLRGTPMGDTLQWNVIGRMLTTTSFIDNGCNAGVDYAYVVKAIDRSRNLSTASDTLKARTDQFGLVLHYGFENALTDDTENQLHAASSETKFSNLFTKVGSYSLNFNGSTSYVKLPVSVGSMSQMTIATWVNSTSTSTAWTRIFDFGNGTDQYMFLTPNNGSEMRFVVKNQGNERVLSAPALSTGWHHVAVTLGEEDVVLYVDGAKVASSDNITCRLSDIHAVLNYLGRSQFDADPLFRGYLDDFRIYNYPLSSADIQKLYLGEEPAAISQMNQNDNLPEQIYNLSGIRLQSPTSGLQIVIRHQKNGKAHITKQLIK